MMRHMIQRIHEWLCGCTPPAQPHRDTAEARQRITAVEERLRMVRQAKLEAEMISRAGGQRVRDHNHCD